MLTVTTLPPGTPSYKPTPTPGRELKILLIRHCHMLPCSLASPAFTFICLHNNMWERKTCEKWGRPGSIHHVNDVRWTSGGQEVEVRWM